MRFWKGVPVAIVLVIGVTVSFSAMAQDTCASAHDLRLINGNIHTMDIQNRIVHEVTIQQGRFAYVGPVGKNPVGPCTKVIDLQGHTVIPGMIDNHNHFVLFGLRVGHDIELETATTIPQALALLKHRSETIPSGAWVTTIGDWYIRQFRENRNPTLAELDQVVPSNPVLIVPSNGTSVTNSLGKKFFESKGIAVTPEGVIGAGESTSAAIAALRAIQTFAEQVEGAQYAQSYMLRFGLTTSVDMGFDALPGSADLQGSAVSPGIASADPWTGYNPFYALDRDGKLNERLRLYIISQDTRPDLPILKQHVRNMFPDYGDDMLRVSGIGEWIAPGFGRPAKKPETFDAALQLIAQYGWAMQQHALAPAEVQITADSFSKVNATTPIAPLHWSIAHVPSIEPATLQAMKAIGVGMALHSRYLGACRPGTTAAVGPPYRTILASGIQVGAGSDAGDFEVLDPWLDLYYMVTGKDCDGTLINPGEQVTRDQAMHMYTVDNGWFSHEENKIGSIETGKLGDLVVLNRDYFDPAKVSDEGIKDLQSVLTVVGGKIVYGSSKLSEEPPQ
jgi:predicted amidohydrolase YtcJ